MDNFIVHHIAVHHIDKRPEMSEAGITLSDKLLPLTDDAIDLILRLETSFEKKTDVLLASMVDEGPVFPEAYGEYVYAGGDFVSLTQRMALDLQDRLQGIIGATGGMLVFCDYTVDSAMMFGVFLLGRKEAYDIDYSEGFDLTVDDYLNVDKLDFSVRVMPFGDRPVQIVGDRKKSSMFMYMTDWLGLDPTSAATAGELTLELLDVVSSLPVPKDEETGYAMNNADFDEALIKFASKRPHQVLKVDAFDNHFYDGQRTLANALDGHPTLGKDLRIDKKILRKKFYLSAGDGGIRITCNGHHIEGGLIHIDEANGTVTINSREIAAQLADQIEE